MRFKIQHRTLLNNFLGFLQKLQINYFLNFFLEGCFKLLTIRSSCPEVFCKKGVLRYFAKFTGKHLHQSFFFNKVAGLRPANSLKKRFWHRCFPVSFVKFLRTPFFIEHLWWLLLNYCAGIFFNLNKITIVK